MEESEEDEDEDEDEEQEQEEEEEEEEERTMRQRQLRWRLRRRCQAGEVGGRGWRHVTASRTQPCARQATARQLHIRTCSKENVSRLAASRNLTLPRHVREGASFRSWAERALLL